MSLVASDAVMDWIHLRDARGTTIEASGPRGTLVKRASSQVLLRPSGLHLHIEAEFDFFNFLYPPNTFGILRDTIE